MKTWLSEIPNTTWGDCLTLNELATNVKYLKCSDNVYIKERYFAYKWKSTQAISAPIIPNIKKIVITNSCSCKSFKWSGQIEWEPCKQTNLFWKLLNLKVGRFEAPASVDIFVHRDDVTACLVFSIWNKRLVSPSHLNFFISTSCDCNCALERRHN